ncbi:hypothetical protein KIPB_006698, partial [Kipferlia bialata]
LSEQRKCPLCLERWCVKETGMSVRTLHFKDTPAQGPSDVAMSSQDGEGDRNR